MNLASPRRRRRSTAHERADWLARLANSGLTVAEFARQHRLSPATLAQWKWKAAHSRPQRPPQLAASPAFHSIDLPAREPNHDWDLEVLLPNGLRFRIRDGCPVRWLQRLFQSLA